MHQDQRVGLALGILLLGAAGAFFFRNDAVPVQGTPRLKTSKHLDARIAEKTLTPYLQGIEEVDEPKPTSARNVSDRNGPSLFPQNGREDDRASEFFGGEDHEPFGSSTSRARSRRPGSSPDLADIGEDIPELAPIPIPDGSELEHFPTPSSRENKAPDGQSPERIHIVQKGETLSSIAAKELGSVNKFIELFEANRDQLKDANDVRVGMKLRVPERKSSVNPRATLTTITPDLLKDSAPPLLKDEKSTLTSESSTEVRGNGSNGQEKDASTSKDSKPGLAPLNGSKKFVSPKKLPLGTRVPGPQTDADDAKGHAGRRLSQLPPDERDGKVAR